MPHQGATGYSSGYGSNDRFPQAFLTVRLGEPLGNWCYELGAALPFRRVQ